MLIEKNRHKNNIRPKNGFNQSEPSQLERSQLEYSGELSTTRTTRIARTTNWLEDEAPREKLLKYGASYLSDTELLAIFLRTGIPGMNVLQWSRHLLEHFGSLHALLSSDYSNLSKAKGIGLAKYAQLRAIAELAQRYFSSKMHKSDIIKNPEITKAFLNSLLSKEERELCVVLFLDSQHRVISHKEMFAGTVGSVTIHPREIVKEALKQNAVSIVLAHNHPSGICEPSEADIAVTSDIINACRLFDIRVIDHLIIGQGCEYSFAQHGYL